MPHVKPRDNGPDIVKGGGYDMPTTDCEYHSRKAASGHIRTRIRTTTQAATSMIKTMASTA